MRLLGKLYLEFKDINVVTQIYNNATDTFLRENFEEVKVSVT